MRIHWDKIISIIFATFFIWLGTTIFDVPIKWETTTGVCERAYPVNGVKTPPLGGGYKP